MKWFRSNIKHGSRLALLALAIQFVLSFGHFHAMASEAVASVSKTPPSEATISNTGPAPPSSQAESSFTAPDATDQSAQHEPGSKSDSDHRPFDNCAICAVIALTNAAMSAAPPLLLLPEAIEFLHETTDAEFMHLNSARVAFQPHAPPAS